MLLSVCLSLCSLVCFQSPDIDSLFFPQSADFPETVAFHLLFNISGWGVPRCCWYSDWGSGDLHEWKLISVMYWDRCEKVGMTSESASDESLFIKSCAWRSSLRIDFSHCFKRETWFSLCSSPSSTLRHEQEGFADPPWASGGVIAAAQSWLEPLSFQRPTHLRPTFSSSSSSSPSLHLFTVPRQLRRVVLQAAA